MSQKKKLNIWLFACCILAIAAYFTDDITSKAILCACIFYSSAMVKYAMPALVYMGASIVTSTIESSVLTFFVVAPIYLIKTYSYKLFHKSGTYIFLIFTTSTFISLSYILGTAPNINTLILFVLCLWLFFIVSNLPISISHIYKYSLFTFAIVASIMLISFLQNNILIISGRLAINDNIRELADVIAIPIFFSLAILITQKCSLSQKIILIIVSLISIFILLATVSKGAIISTITAVAIVYLLSSKNIASRLFFLIIIVFIIYVEFSYIANMDMFRLERLAEQDEGFSGRTDIWSTYYTLMSQNTTTLLFGFGPGDIKRLGVMEYYSHSLFLDILFSYGVLLSSIFLIGLIRLFLSIVKSRNVLSLGLFIFTCLLYTTHGVSTNSLFYILLGISFSFSRTFNNNAQIKY